MKQQSSRIRRRYLAAIFSAVISAGFPVSPGSRSRAMLFAADQREIKATIAHGVAYLQETIPKMAGGEASLGALAMLKAGIPAANPVVLTAIQKILARTQDEGYAATGGHTRIYTAGVDIMVLANADPELYLPEMEVIVDYILSEEHHPGYWDYPPPRPSFGDTSMTQYGLLGLWAATRSGIAVPKSVWDRVARWHVMAQQVDGGFTYRPGSKIHPGSTHTMAAAGAGSLLICRLHLYGEAKSKKRSPEQKAANGAKKKFDVLETPNLDTGAVKTSKTAAIQGGDGDSYNPELGAGALDASARRAIAWSANHYGVGIGRVRIYPLYYLYSLERMTALANLPMLGEHDWYSDGAALLIKTQQANGSWGGQSGQVPATSFALLFLTKATAKVLNRPETGPTFDPGLMRGGRNLPKDLKKLQVQGGEVKERKSIGPIDDLLAELEKPKNLSIGAAQSAILEKIQFGDRKGLVGQKKRLLKLVNDPRVEVRRTALWALGRTDGLEVAPVLIRALEDSDVDVMVEARNALCWLSRRPTGFGLSASPLHGVDEDATAEQRTEAAAKWRVEAVRRWRQWHRRVRSYEERDFLLESRLSEAPSS